MPWCETIVWRSLRTTVIGLVLGLVLAALITKALGAVLPGATAADPVALGGTLVILLVVAFASSFLPARRATGIDPLIVLRTN